MSEIKSLSKTKFSKIFGSHLFFSCNSLIFWLQCYIMHLTHYNLDLYTLIWSTAGVNHSCFLPSECVHKIPHFVLIPLVADSFVGVAGSMQNFSVGISLYFYGFSEQSSFDSSIMSFLLTFISSKGDTLVLHLLACYLASQFI